MMSSESSYRQVAALCHEVGNGAVGEAEVSSRTPNVTIRGNTDEPGEDVLVYASRTAGLDS